MTIRRPLVIAGEAQQRLQTGDTLSVGRGVISPGILLPMAGINSSASALSLLRAYFCYMGQVGQDITVAQLRLTVSTAGAGAQTAEAALYSSLTAPAGAALDLTRIGAGATFTDSLITTGGKFVTLNQAVAEGTHLWAAFHCNMATTAPQMYRTMFDIGVLGLHTYVASTATALTAAGMATVTAATQTLPAFNASGVCMVLTS